MKYGILPTTVESASVEGKNCFVFIGDKQWQSNLWKISLFTYYLKKIVSEEEEYDKALYTTTEEGVPYEEIFLSKIVTHFDEWIPEKPDFAWTHNASGFVSISMVGGFSNTPGNEIMHRRIIKGEETK